MPPAAVDKTGAVDHVRAYDDSEFGAEKSCPATVARPVAVLVAFGRDTWNTTSLPGTAAVWPISTRMPVSHDRFVAGEISEISGVTAVDASVTTARTV